MKLKIVFALVAMLPFFASCSSSSNEEPAVTNLQLLSSSPTNGDNGVSIETTQIVLNFNEDIKVMPMGYYQITLNGSMIKNDISYDGKQVYIALHEVAAATSYELNIPANMIATSDGKTKYESAISIKFTTAKAALDVTADVTPDKSGMTSDAIAWTHKIYAGWNLGNSFESVGGNWDDNTKTWTNIWYSDFNSWETAWGNPKTTNDMIVAVKNAGFNAVRIPVRWFPHVTNEETMEIDNAWIGRVKEVVDYCVNNGMYAIINTHHDLWMENHPFDSEAETISKKEIALWRNIATYFRDYDEHLVFAGTNEVNVNWQTPSTENARVQNGFNQDFVKAVRSTGGRNWYRPLIVQTYSSNAYYGLSYFVTPNDVVDNRLIVEFHYYDPYEYCGSCSVYYWGKEYAQYGSISSSDETTVQTLFANIANQWIKKGLGVVMGESGVAYHTAGSSSGVQHQIDNMRYYLKTIFSTAKSNGIAPFVWDNNAFENGKENFGIFERNNGMKVGQTCFLDGIMEGAKTVYPS